MKNNIAFVGIMVVAIMAAGCGKQPEGEAQLEPSATAAAESAPAAEPSVATVRFGRFVNSDTHRVGGGATLFNQQQRIFAEVRLANPAASSTVGMRMKNEAGDVVSELSREVRGNKRDEAKVNFTIGDAATVKPLPEGTYTVETSLDGKVAKLSKIVVRN